MLRPGSGQEVCIGPGEYGRVYEADSENSIVQKLPGTGAPEFSTSNFSLSKKRIIPIVSKFHPADTAGSPSPGRKPVEPVPVFNRLNMTG